MKREDGHRISPKCPTLHDRERQCGREEMLRWVEGMERTEHSAIGLERGEMVASVTVETT